jgi:hypothetical protein
LQSAEAALPPSLLAPERNVRFLPHSASELPQGAGQMLEDASDGDNGPSLILSGLI